MARLIDVPDNSFVRFADGTIWGIRKNVSKNHFSVFTSNGALVTVDLDNETDVETLGSYESILEMLYDADDVMNSNVGNVKSSMKEQ